MTIPSLPPAASGAARSLALAAALVLLNVSLTFANVWPTAGVRLTAALSLETALLVLGLVLAGRIGPGSALPPAALRLLALLWVALTLGRYADVTARSLYGRDINLYWDLGLLPDVGAMLAFVARPALLAVVAGVAVVLPLALYGLQRWAIGVVAAGARGARTRVLLAGLAGAVILVRVALGAGADLPGSVRVAEPVLPVFARQAGQLAFEMTGAGVRALPPATPIRSDLSLVRGADVFLVFVESYGAVSWDGTPFLERLAPARDRFQEDVRATGRRVVSAFVESTTFGGESWLAHISLMAGTEVRDQDTNVRLMAQRRDTLVTAFARLGYRTVAAMPGLQRDWPQGAFYGFDELYGASKLAYRGPTFGWWDITDQYVLARLDVLAVTPRPRAPLFVFFPTISTHTPFLPSPPYQEDWTRILTPTPYDPDVLERAWSETPDWLNLAPGYGQSLEYIYASLGGYLRLRDGHDLVMVLVGDHQPPAIVSGENAPWDVPVHVIASRDALLDRLRREGFGDGLRPRRPVLTTMHGLLPVLLRAFGDEADADRRAAAAASAPAGRTAQ